MLGILSGRASSKTLAFSVFASKWYLVLTLIYYSPTIFDKL
jgi:hypothetical protein